MAESDGLKAIVAEQVSEQLDVSDLLDGGSLEDGLDGGEIGASVGRQFGERVGYEFGTAVGRSIHETMAEGVEQDRNLDDIRSDLVDAVRDAFTEALETVGVTDSLGLEADGETADDEPDEERTESDDDSDEPAEDADEFDAGAEGDQMTAEDLDGLRRETLEEFLSIMSYTDLQSVAKDVDVKANLSREEMTERIVEAVTDSDDELAATANEEAP